jgi:two-component system, OmpR family, phosphate regulon response regulator PhoB
MVDQAYAPVLTSTSLGETAERHLDVLVVDDDASVRLIAMEALSTEGYGVLEAHDGASAIRMIREGNVDVVVLDLGLPEISGLDVLTSVREFSDLPILILSGRSDEGDLIQGLRLGADDYMVKPCSPRELAARVNTVLRRARRLSPPTQLDFVGMRIDLAAHEVAVDGRPVELTPLEFQLLACLAQRPRTVMSRAELLQCVWESSSEWQTPATVTEHVRRLRGKIEITPQDPRWVITVRGLGYRFEPR